MAEEFKPQYSFTDDRLNELRQLFPEAWEDGVFNIDTLKELIGNHSTENSIKEHFGLNWVGKKEARRMAAKSPSGTLKFCPGEGVNESKTENIFIEGENLEVLKILRKSYMNKIKMIYIDPPYNTGNDFIYNDSFIDSTEDYLIKTGENSDKGLLVSNPKSSGRYHAKWLSFMLSRLKVSKDLLTDDGVIFVSIGVEELSHLKVLMNEVFGEENFIEVFSWAKTETPPNLSLKSKKILEYIICFQKIKNSDRFSGVQKRSKSDDPLTKPQNSIKSLKFPAKSIYVKMKDGTIPSGVYGTDKYPNTLLNSMEVKDNYNENEVTFKNRFIWTQPKLEAEIQNGTVINCSKNIVLSYKKSDYNAEVPPNLINDKVGVGTNDNAGEYLKKLFGEKVFDFPKPVNLIEYLINFNYEEDQIVLDFFAGSGTTGEAVYNFVEKNRKCKYICIQIPEKLDDTFDSESGKQAKKNAIAYLNKKNKPLNIAELSKERLRLAIEQKFSKQGFKVYKQSSSTIYKWKDYKPKEDGTLLDLFSKIEMAYKNPINDGVKEQDFITEVILQEGFPLTANQKKIANGIFKITHEWVPYTLYATMLYDFENIDFDKLELKETDHFVCLDKAFKGNDALKQILDNKCKLYTI